LVVIQYARLFAERNAEVPAGTYGTRPGSPTFEDLRLLSESIEGGPDLTPESDAETPLSSSGMDVAGKTYSGGLTQKVRVDDGIGEMLLGLFGKVVTAQVDPGPPIVTGHTYTPLDDFASVAPSYGLDLGIEKAREYQYSGVLVNALTLTKTGAADVNLAWEIIAKNRTAVAFDGAHVPSYSTKTKLQAVQTATLDGQAIVWETLTITLRRNWDQTKNFSATTLPKAEIGAFDIEVTGNLKFENANPNFEAEFEQIVESLAVMEMTITFRGDNIVTTFFEELTLEFDKLRIDQLTPAHIDGVNRKVEGIRLVGHRPATGDWAKVTLQNELLIPATYPP